LTTTKQANNYKCPECNESFSAPQVLGRHRKFKHGIEGKSRAAKHRAAQQRLDAALNAPASKPRGSYKSKSLKCPECGKQYSAATGLGRHRQIAHGIEGTSHSTKSKRSQLAKLPNKANGHVNGAHQETHAAPSDPYEIPVAIAFGRFREICTSMAIEHDVSPRLFAARFAELVYRSTLR
jgi:hypothetical protein